MLTGDIQGLFTLAARLKSSDGLLLKTSQKCAAEFSKMVEANFAAGRDPYGSGWAALAPSTRARGRTPPALTDTGRMRWSSRVFGEATRILFEIDSPAVFHQFGTGRMPARPIYPIDGLPDSWRDLITRVARETVTDHFTGK